jgi:hypothetical protein
MTTIELGYEALSGNFRRFESGQMQIFFDGDTENIIEVHVINLHYDNGDYWGNINEKYKIGETVQILNMNLRDIGGVIESFKRSGDVIEVKLVNKPKYYYLIDCIKAR